MIFAAVILNQVLNRENAGGAAFEGSSCVA
jgi:hypothetical protein